MLWRIALEVVIVFVLVMLGSSFWACLKAPTHMRSLLSDQSELRRLIDHFGFDGLYTEALNLKSDNHLHGELLLAWEYSHYRSLSQTRNMLSVGVVAVLLASWWLGWGYLAVSVGIFALTGFGGIPASAKNNNAKHLPTVILHLIKWMREDPQQCAQFCTVQHPDYRNLYSIIVELLPQIASASNV